MAQWPERMKSVDGGFINFHKRDLAIRIGKVDTSRPKVGVAHTTETPHINLDWSRGAPTHAIGPLESGGRPIIQQLIPLGWMGTALRNPSGGVETNRWSYVQFELAGYSSREPWLPNRETQVILASFFEFCREELGIKEDYPYDISQLRTGTWAVTSNPWRRRGDWGGRSGWFGHVAVPENDHWDPGALRMGVLLNVEPEAKMVEAHQLVAAWRGEEHHHPDGTVHMHWVSEAVSPHFRRKSDLRAWMVNNGQLRLKVWDHLRQDHIIRVATRRVDADRVEG